MNHVFISYSSKDRCTADSVRVLLQKNGIKCWMAPHDIPVGQKYAGVITTAVRECGCFLLLLSNESQRSTWVAKEVERAVNYNKSIITIQLEDVVLNDEFELYISSEQMVAVHDVDVNNENMQKVLNAIVALVGTDNIIETIEGVRTLRGSELEFGDILNERYCIGRKIGEGGFGTVYQATDYNAQKECVLKISREPAMEGYYVEKTTVERIMQVKSPYLCEVTDCFEFTDRLCVVEEHLNRYVILKDYVEISRLNTEESISLILCILEGLKALHDNGIYHGDVSSYNIMVSTDGKVKITDYSSSWLKSGKSTGEHTAVLSYVAPDSAYSESSEIFSVGVIAFEILTSSYSMRDDDGRLVNCGKPIPKELGDILNKAAALAAENRYKNADEFIVALKQYISTDEVR